MDNFVKLAKEIHSRTNQKIIGMCVGEVVSLTPVTIRIYYNGVALDFTEFFSTKGIINGGRKITTGEMYVEEYPVEVGDKFICMAGADNQSIYVLERFESIKSLYIYLTGEGGS